MGNTFDIKPNCYGYTIKTLGEKRLPRVVRAPVIVYWEKILKRVKKPGVAERSK